MRVHPLILTVALCILMLFLLGAPVRAQDGEAPLTNSAVMKLVRAGFRESTVVAIIRSRPTRFDLAPERLIELKKGGVSEKVILAMLDVGQGMMDEGAAWVDDDDPLFNDRGDKSDAARSGTSDPGAVNIFGSSGGSRGRVRTRGGTSGSEGETQTTGSATVRILRPPAEAGNAPPKLERTPTLTNDSVVELVEAGFTEGTIIRRIEQSPAEYDLAPLKIAELRRRRVTEPVIVAMRAAMNDDPAETVKP